MPIDNILQETNLIATLAGILGGFAFSAVVQLLASGQSGKMTTAAIVIFTLATLLFLYTLFVFVLIGSTTAELNRQVVQLDPIGTFAFLLAFLGLILFLIGVGLTGWIRSRAAGIATSIMVGITLCLTAWAFIAINSVFLQ